MAGKDEKGLIRGGVGGQEAELTNKIAPEGSLGENERRPLPGNDPAVMQQGRTPGTRPRNPFMDQESQARLDREMLIEDEIE